MKKALNQKPYISPVQKLVLEFITTYVANLGYAPTQEEIAEGCKIGRTLAQYHVQELARKGYVHKRGSSRRNLVIAAV